MERFGLVNPEAGQSARGGRGAREGCNSGEGEGGAKWGGARGEGEANRGEAEGERAVLNGRSRGDEGGAKGRS